MKKRFLTASAAAAFAPVCIAQLIPVEPLRRRQRLAQIQGASLSKSRFFMLFVYRISKKSYINSQILFWRRYARRFIARSRPPFGVFCESELQISGYQADSRMIQPGELFFALKGEKNDGHSFFGRSGPKRSCRRCCFKRVSRVDRRLDFAGCGGCAGRLCKNWPGIAWKSIRFPWSALPDRWERRRRKNFWRLCLKGNSEPAKAPQAIIPKSPFH